jgi:GMP synthase (glutamine-hydrolysing)
VVLVVQHGADDPPLRVGRWLTERGCVLTVVRGYLGEELPASLTGFDGLVVLGGAMGAYDDEVAPWLVPTRVLLAEAAERDIPTLAICLGHQLLAVANHGRVQRQPVHHVGVTPVGLIAAAGTDPLFAGLEPDASALHWNNDLVVETPPGAVVLARSRFGVQAFRIGSSVYGVQFHPEVEVETVAGWARDDVLSGDLTAAEADQELGTLQRSDDQLSVTWRAFTHRFAGLLGDGS